MNKKKILYIDMDGVICDFDKAKDKWNEEHPDIKYPQRNFDFFRTLEPIKDAIRCIKNLNAFYDVYFLTAPSIKNPMCYTEKAVWIRNHFGQNWLNNLIITPQKHLNKGDFLIDDNHTGHGQSQFEGELILFGSAKYPNWNHIALYLALKQNYIV